MIEEKGFFEVFETESIETLFALCFRDGSEFFLVFCDLEKSEKYGSGITKTILSLAL